MATLKQKTVSGFKWLVINNVTQKAISIATFAILARILQPATFGLFAMAFIAIDGLSMFKTFGFDGSIIQKKNLSEEANHTAFFTIEVMSILLFIICFAAAPMLARFFNNPDLGSILRALGVVFILSGFGRVPSAILTRQLRFRLISTIDLIGSTVNCICATIFALLWQNVWALVGAYLVKQTIMTGLSWYFSGFRLKWQYDWKLAKELFHFGKYLMALSLLWYVGQNASSFVIAKLLTTTALGYYALAVNIGNVINSQFTNIISRVMFPAYSAIQGDPETLKRAYLKTIKFISILSLPFSLGLICVAKEFVLTLYGEKWLPIVPLIQLLGIVQMIAPLLIASGSLYRGCGKPEYDFRINLAQILFFIPIMVVLTKLFGLIGTVVAVMITSVVIAPVEILVAQKIAKFTFREFFRQLVPAAVCSAIMLIALLAIQTIFALMPLAASSHLFMLIVLALGGMCTYAVSFFFVDYPTTLEVKKMIFKLESA